MQKSQCTNMDSRDTPKRKSRIFLYSKLPQFVHKQKQGRKRVPFKTKFENSNFPGYNDYRKACQLTDFVFPRQNSIATTSELNTSKFFFQSCKIMPQKDVKCSSPVMNAGKAQVLTDLFSPRGWDKAVMWLFQVSHCTRALI